MNITIYYSFSNTFQATNKFLILSSHSLIQLAIELKIAYSEIVHNNCRTWF